MSNESKFQRKSDAKLEKDIGVTYGGDTTDIENKNFILDGLWKVLSNNISHLIIDGISALK